MTYNFKDLMALGPEAIGNGTEYRDYTNINESDIPAELKGLAPDQPTAKLATWILEKGIGKDVRLALALAVQWMNLLANKAKQIASDTAERQDNLETQTAQSVAQMEADKNAVIANATVDSEVILARGGKDTLSQRLDDTDAQLAHIESDVNVKSASICLIDDDSKIEFLTELKPILDSYGWKASIAVPSSTIGNPTNMDITQLRGLISEGFEVVSHGYDNTRLGDVSKSVVRTQLQSATDTFKELGIESDVLVYAQGSSSQEASEVVKDFFKVALDSSGIRNTEPTDTYNLKRVPIGPWGINDIDVLKTIVWNAHQNKELLVLETHKYAHTPEQDILLNELFSYIDNLGHKVTTFSEAYQKHNNKIEYGHYNYDMGMSGLMIGKDGTLNGLALPKSTLRDGSVDSDSKPKDFLFHADRKYENFSQEFTSKISGAENNLPDEAKLSNGTYRGSLTTNIKVIDGNMFHVFQTFRRNNDNRYWTRQASSREEWGAWRTFSPDEIIREKPPIDAKPSYYNYKKGLEINTYSNAEVADTTLPGGGTIITTCVGVTNAAFVKQDYRGYQNNEYYIRSGKADDTWTSWVNIRE